MGDRCIVGQDEAVPEEWFASRPQLFFAGKPGISARLKAQISRWTRNVPAFGRCQHTFALTTLPLPFLVLCGSERG
jgi:hypothetical protein